eukprot:2751385-Rhodomonas_salina.1
MQEKGEKGEKEGSYAQVAPGRIIQTIRNVSTAHRIAPYASSVRGTGDVRVPANGDILVRGKGDSEVPAKSALMSSSDFLPPTPTRSTIHELSTAHRVAPYVSSVLRHQIF